ncbi:hypothetical protein Dimus_023050 [Dionaea muscipula]
MFSQFGATADTLSKASTLVLRFGTDAHLYDDPDDVNIASLLDSKFDSEKCEALKRLLALIAQGIDVSNFFPQVVKNVASHSLEVKKLVYLYLLHYAEKRPSEALLSINCFQKDLGDINPLVRAWALRTMAGIRLHVIAPLVLVAVSKCARDPSVYVRKCAANALPKLNDVRHEDNVSAIEEIIGILLNDNSPGVIGAAAAAFNSVCPNNFSMIGRNYGRLCEILPDVEEWGQIILIGILLRYVIAKHGLVKESIMSSLCSSTSNYLKNEVSTMNTMAQESGYEADVTRSYIEGPDEYLSRSSYRNGPYPGLDDTSFTSAESNNDVMNLLKCTSPLLWSHNSAVVLAAAGLHWIFAPKDNLQRIVKPLLFLLRSSSDSHYVVLCNIQVFAKAMPSLFASYYEDFFISSSDSYQIKSLKLEILASIATDSSIHYIFQEFQDYIRDQDRRFAADTVAAIGLCAQRVGRIANECLEGLLSLIRQESLTGEQKVLDEEAGVLIQAVTSIKEILKHDPLSYDKVIIQLVRSLDFIKVAAARATIIWMLGEYNSLGERIPRMLTTTLKYLALCFTSETSETKLQILNAASKVLLYAEGKDLLTIQKIVSYVLDLAKHDLNYDIRDRARVFNKVLAGHLGSKSQDESFTLTHEESAHVAEKIFGCRRKQMHNEPLNVRSYLPGSLSQIVLHAAPGYEPLPKPSSLLLADLGSDLAQQMEGPNDSYETDDSDTSGSVNEQSSSVYSSQHSVSGSSFNDDGEENGSVSEGDEDPDPLVQILDDGNAYNFSAGNSPSKNTLSGYGGMEENNSRSGLESLLVEHHVPSYPTSKADDYRRRSSRISIADISSRVKPKYYTLLDSASGNGLRIDYSFTSKISNISPLLVCLDVSFQNCSTEAFSEVTLMEEESNKGPESTETSLVARERTSAYAEVPTLVPMKEIDSLEPGQKVNRIIQVRFHHHLLPLKLALWCNGKKRTVKLRPDIGYFVKPLAMDVEAFQNKEAQLPGMFEYARSCTFRDHIQELSEDGSSAMKDMDVVLSESLALKMLSNTNLFLVSLDMREAAGLDDVSGWCLRFSSEILSSSVPCLITIAAEGKSSEPLNVSVKVNCEETVFGLNLLNRVVNFLAEPSS